MKRKGQTFPTCGIGFTKIITMAVKYVQKKCFKWIKTKRGISFIIGCLCTCALIANDFGHGSFFRERSGASRTVLFDGKLHPNVTAIRRPDHGDVSAYKNGTFVKAFVDINHPKLNEKLNPSRQKIHSHIHHLVKTSEQDKTRKISKATKTYSFEEMKQRVRTEKEFFERIMGQEYILPNTKVVLERYLLNQPFVFAYNATLKAHLKQNFSMDSDVIVFLHIQKTGGMHFNDRINRELQKPFQCKCRRIRLPKGACNCLNPQNNMWFYNTAYAGWQCGLHADWTQMHICIPGLVEKIEKKQRQRRYFYFTHLRDAVERYLSEYHHQTTKNHWQDAILGCGHTLNANKRDVQPCFLGQDWRGVTLDNFMACKDNLATHRMTRMLADLTIAGCYTNFTDINTIKARAPIWLESAKHNLQTMEYIGLMEDEAASDKLFYQTYNLSFRKVLSHSESRNAGRTLRLTEEQFLKILRLAELDIHLYLFGRDLFYKRLQDASYLYNYFTG